MSLLSSASTTKPKKINNALLTKPNKVKGLLAKKALPTIRESKRSISKYRTSFLECIQNVKILETVQRDTNDLLLEDSDAPTSKSIGAMPQQLSVIKDDGNNPATMKTHFYENLLNWNELNLTQDYQNFEKQVVSMVRTLPELLYHKKTVVEIIVKNLHVEDSTALYAIFDLTTSLANDLRQEFYPFFRKLFDPIVQWISPTDMKLNEAIFQTLAYLFKYLSKYMIKDLAPWFQKYSKLIGHKKWFIRKFAAESFSFLINKLPEKQLPQYIDKTFDLLAEIPTQDMFDGTSQMFFECVKGVYGNFHSRMPIIMTLLLRKLDYSDVDTKMEASSDNQKFAEIQRRFALMQKLVALLIDHSRTKQVAVALWKIFFEEIELLVKRRTKETEKEMTGIQIGHIVELLRGFVSRERTDKEYLSKILQLLVSKELLQSADLPDVTLQSILQLLQVVIKEHQKFLFKELKTVFFNVLCVKQSPLLYTFFNEVVSAVHQQSGDQESGESEFFKNILQFVQEKFDEDDEQALTFLLNFTKTANDNMIDGQTKRIVLGSGSPFMTKVVGLLQSQFNVISKADGKKLIIDKEDDEPLPGVRLHVIWASLICIQRFELSNTGKITISVQAMFEALYNTLVKFCKEDSIVRQDFIIVLCEALRTYLTLLPLEKKTQKKKLEELFETVMKMMERLPTSEAVLEISNQYFDMYVEGDSVVPHKQFLRLLATRVKNNLQSRSAPVRLFTLSILTKFEQSCVEGTKTELQTLFSLKKAEECGVEWETSQDRIYQIERAIQDVERCQEKMPKLYVEMLSHYVIGGLYTKLQLVWKPLLDLARSLMRLQFNTFWPIYYPKLVATYEESRPYLQEQAELAPFVYKKENKKNDPGHQVNFQNYNKFKKIHSLTALGQSFSAAIEEKHDTKYTDAETMLSMLWGDILDDSNCGDEATKRNPGDIYRFFQLFYKYELKPFDVEGILMFLPRAKITDRLKSLLKAFARIESTFYHSDKKRAEWLLGVLMRLVSTSNSEVQHIAISCLERFELEWLSPYGKKLHALVNVKQNSSLLNAFPLHTIKEPSIRNKLIPFVIKILEPALMRYDLKREKRKSARDKQMNQWRSRAHAVIIWLGKQLARHELRFFIVSFFQRFISFGDTRENMLELDPTLVDLPEVQFSTVLSHVTAGKLKWLLNIVEEMIGVEADDESHYTPFFDFLLDMLMAIVNLNKEYATQDTIKVVEEPDETEQIEETEEKEDEDEEMSEETEKVEEEEEEATPEVETSQEVEEKDNEEDDDSDKEEEPSEEKTEEYYSKRAAFKKRQFKEAYSHAVDMLISFFQNHSRYPFQRYFIDQIVTLFNHYFVQHFANNIDTLPRIFNIILSWFKNPEMYYLLNHYRTTIIDRLWMDLSRSTTKVSGTVMSCVTRSIQDIIRHKDALFQAAPEDSSFEAPTEEIVGDVLIQPYTNRIITQFYDMIQRDRELYKRFYVRTFNIIDGISNYFTDDSPADIILTLYGQAINMMSTKAKANNFEAEERTDKVIGLYKRYMPYASKETRDRFLKQFSNMFVTNRDEEFRLELIGILEQVAQQSAKEFKHMQQAIDTIRGLNAYSSERIGEVDINSRLEHFGKIIKGDKLFDKFGEQELYPIVCNLIYFVSDEQWIIRENATKALCALVPIIGRKKFDDIKTLLMSHIKKGAFGEQKKNSHAGEYFSIFSQVVMHFDEYRELEKLREFFEIMSEATTTSSEHQKKRIEGAKLFKQVAISGSELKRKLEISDDNAYVIFVPLFVQQLISAATGSNEKEDRDLYDVSLSVIVDLSLILAWEHSQKLVNQFVNMLSVYSSTANPVKIKRRKIALKVLCGILEQFNFEQRIKGQNDAQQMRDYFVNGVVPVLEQNIWEKKKRAEGSAGGNRGGVKGVHDEVSVMRMNITYLIIKILKKCDKKALSDTLSKIILNVIFKLKSKFDEQQRVAQQTLVSILKELGSEYFHYTLRKLCDALKMEGYKMELLYNTLHILLKALKNKMQNVRIDDAVPLVLQVLMHEVTQPAAKVEGKRRMNRFEEDADKTSKEEKKEQKDIMGVSAQGEGLLLNCFEVLASVVTFDVSVNTIIQAIEKVMVNVYSRPILKRFETILQKIIVGFTKNTTVTEQGLITYVQKVINDKNLYHREFETIKNKKNDKFSVESNKSQIVKNHRSEEHFMVQKNPGRAGKIEDYDEKRTEQTLSISKESNDHMIVHFSVMLLEMALKHHVIRGLNDGVAVEVLGKTLIPKLVKYISGKHVSLALCSLRVLIHLSQQNTKNTLPILQEKKQTMLDGVFDLISNSGANTTGETWDTLFAALRFFLQDQSNIKMTERQLQVLLDMLKVEIYGSSQNKEFNIRSFQLLHTLITRKVMLPQIYDMMERVKTIMITANDTQIQDESIAMLTHFYLNYPFDDQVHQDNLNFMFKNIMNETLPQTGKQAMVKMVRSMIVQLPVLFLQERAEFVFCPLALQLANTALERLNTASIESLMTKNSVHEQFYTTLEDALFQFVKRIPEQVLMAKIMPLVTQQWMENKKLNFVAIRSLMVLARIANGARLKSGGHLESKGSILTFILSSIQADTKSKDATKKKKNILMLECSLEILCELYRHGNVSHATIDSMWKSLTGLLSVTTNAETRFLSLQVLELYFSRAKSVLSETKSNLSERTNVLGVITLVTENLKQLSGKMLFMDQERNQQYIETLIKIMLEALKLVLRAEEKSDQVVEDLFGHLRKISIRADSDKQKPDLIRNNYMTFLKLFVAICAKLKALVTPYLTYMTPLLYVCTEYPKRNELRFVTQKEQQFAVDVKQVIQKQWEQMNSFETFIKAYETGKEEVLKKAQTRKQKEDLKAVKDPIAFAKQKLKDKERLSQLKKRKRVETKEAKESTPQQQQRPKKRIKK